MANNTTFTEQDRDAFGVWLNNTYGDGSFQYFVLKYTNFDTGETDYNFTKEPIFQQWLKLGKPSGSNSQTSEIYSSIAGLEAAIKAKDWNSVNYLIDKANNATQSTDALSTKTLGAFDSTWIVTDPSTGAVFFVPRFTDGTVDMSNFQYLFQTSSTGTTPELQGQIAQWAEENLYNKAVLAAQIQQWGVQNGLDQQTINNQREQYLGQLGLSYAQLAESKFQFEQQNDLAKQQLDLSRQEFAWNKEFQTAQLEDQKRQTQAALNANPANWVQAYEYKTGKLPPAPNWLPEYAPNVNTNEISRVAMKTPSGQAWNAMPSGQRAMLGGYATFANAQGAPQNESEINEEVASMLPNETRQRAWRPISQV